MKPEILLIRLGASTTPADVPALEAALLHRAVIVKRTARTALDRLAK